MRTSDHALPPAAATGAVIDPAKLVQHCAANAGEITLSTVDQTVVGSIPSAGTYAGLAITYRLAAATAAGPVPTTVRTVVLTVVPGP
jgi:hypothetical protein